VRRWTMSGAGCWTCSCFWCARRPASHQCMPGKNSSRNDAMDDTPPDRRCAKPLAQSFTLKRKECIFFIPQVFKSVTFILHVSFTANQSLNYLNWCIYHLTLV
jgi:hypothetical protein